MTRRRNRLLRDRWEPAPAPVLERDGGTIPAALAMNEPDLTFEELRQRYYRWWTVKVWKWGVKLGPVSIFGYRWFDQRVRIGLCAFSNAEIILWGGPLE